MNQHKVLIVDDEVDLRRVIRKEFELDDFVVLEASNGAETLELLARQKVDLIISDVRMPVLSGMELLKAIREKNPRDPLVILMSGFADFGENEAVRSGALAMVAKPVDMEGLLRMSAESLASR